MKTGCRRYPREDSSAHYFDHAAKHGDCVKVNGDDIGYTDDYLAWYEGRFMHLEDCPFCHNTLKIISKKDEIVRKPRICGLEACLWCCDNCTYWQFLHLPYQFVHNIIQNDANDCYLSKLNEFPDSLPVECHQELSVHLRRHPAIWHDIPPTELEKLVASIFRANYEHTEVIHVGRPDDGGVDVLFIDAKDKKWLIQVKRRENPVASEGISTLRNLLGAMVLNNTLKGVLVSTADHFTYRVNEAVSKAAKVGFQVNLIDRGKLNRMLDPLLPPNPWMTFMEREYDEELCGYFDRRISCCYLEVCNDEWQEMHGG